MKPTHYISSGEGLPVVLVHGLASSCRDWDALLPELARAGYRGYAPDLLGHGESYKPENQGDYQTESVYKHFEAWISGLRLRDLPILVGHSLGGSICLYYALRNPGLVRGLVLLNPFYTVAQLPAFLRLLLRAPQFGVKAVRLTPPWMIRLAIKLDLPDSRYCSRSVNNQTAEDYYRASPYIVHIPASLPDLTSHLSKVSIPVKVIWGEKDITLNPSFYPKMVKAFPHATGHVIRNRGHKPHLSRQSDTHRLILDFISSLQPVNIKNTKLAVPYVTTKSS